MIYSGSGNMFVLLDNRQRTFDYHAVPFLCDENAVDGCILVEPSTIADARMRTFNSDGSEAEMCGNGLRCFIHFLHSLGINRERYSIETGAGIHYGWFEGDEIVVKMPSPTDIRWNLQDGALHYLNTGVPHLVLFVEDVAKCDVYEKGYALCHNEELAPDGANVNFVELGGDHTLLIRTFERGVDDETLACGTGCVAAALAANYLYGISSPVTIHVLSTDELKISFTSDWRTLILKGPVMAFDNIETTHI